VGAWSIPKGELSDAEDPLQAAVREVVRFDFDAAHLRSNTFSMEWPPRSGREQTFHEVDRAEWFDLDAARTKILKGQVGFINELERKLGSG
jgi:predicted NUDIX family NTP pyrophosphohydrolase